MLLAEAARPDFVLTCDPDKINVGPGGRVPVFVRLTRRHGFAGAGDAWTGRACPRAVSASPLTIRPAMTEGVIVVSATAGAEHAAALVTLKGTARAPAGPIVRRGDAQGGNLPARRRPRTLSRSTRSPWR